MNKYVIGIGVLLLAILIKGYYTHSIQSSYISEVPLTYKWNKVESMWIDRNAGNNGVNFLFDKEKNQMLLHYKMNNDKLQYVSIQVTVKENNNNLLIYIDKVDALDESQVNDTFLGFIKNNKVISSSQIQVYVDQKPVNFGFGSH